MYVYMMAVDVCVCAVCVVCVCVCVVCCVLFVCVSLQPSCTNMDTQALSQTDSPQLLGQFEEGVLLVTIWCGEYKCLHC